MSLAAERTHGAAGLTPLVPVAATALLLAVALACVAIWGRNIGMAEDWHMVAAMTGNEPDLAAWLWSQNNEHRLPVQRLIYLGLLRITGDFRSGMVFSQLLLAALALALVRVATLARGGEYRLSDALLPVALLHLGHWENLLWGWQIQFVWSVALAGLLLAVVVAHDRPIRGRAGLAAVLLMVLLPLSGANGIVIAAVMAPWLVAQGLAHLGAPGLRPPGDPATRRTGYALLVGTATALAMIAIYFVGYERPEWSPPLASGPEFLQAAEAYFAYALGPGARREALLAAALVLGFVLCGAGLAARAAIARPEERLRAGGLVLYIGAGLALGVAIALARGAYPHRMPDRYALLAVLPLLGAAYAWDLYAPRRIGHAAVAGLALLLVALLPLNVQSGFQWRNWYAGGMRQVEADIAAGTAIPVLAERHHPFLMHWSEDRLREAMQMLHKAGIGPIADTVDPDEHHCD